MPSVELLSRTQFGFTLTFHYIYPPLSIGISLLLIVFEGLYLKTKSKEWERLTKFWIRIFALTFALGVATGIPLQFSLGTNWSRYSRFVGDVFGSALSAEGLFAFLIEGGFLGLLLFGWNKMSNKMHFFSTCMVSFGAHFSAFWITSANSWMQAPSAYELITDKTGMTVAKVTNWLGVVFNPMALSSIIHVILSAWLTGIFLVLSVSAYYLLKKRHIPFALKGFKVAIYSALLVALLQLFSADHLAGDVAKYNPTKLAAFEGLFDTTADAPAYIAGWVDTKKEKTRGLKIPGLLSFLVHKDSKKPVEGLRAVPKEEWPLVNVVFQLYHLMILCWALMFFTALLGFWMLRKNRWKKGRWVLRLCMLSVVFPQVANISGWYSRCMGRQPWTVYKLLKTKDAFSPTVTAAENLFSLTFFVILYLSFLALFLFLLDRKIKKGLEFAEDDQVYREVFT